MTADLEALRGRVLQLLQDERRAMHTGEIAARLGVPTHQVQSAMHVPLQRGTAWFHSSEGYSLPPAGRAATPDDGKQQRLGLRGGN